MRGKKASHVGMILSFVVFVTFAVFLYSVLEPAIKSDRDQQDLLDYLEIELVNLFSGDITTESISIEHSYHPDETCLFFPNIAGTENMNSLVKNSDDEQVASNQKTGGVEILWDSQDNFLKIYYSNESLKELPHSESTCAIPIEDQDYSIGTVRTRNYVFEKKIENIINLYETNYESLKATLKLPEGTEFGFSFTNSSGGVIGTPTKDVSISVYTEELPIQYITEDAKIEFGFIDLRIWG